MMINYAHRQLAGADDDEYPRIAKKSKPSGPFVQWMLADELRSDPKNASSANGTTQENKTYFAKEVVFVEDYAGIDATDIFVHIYEVVPATKADGSLDVFNGTAGAEVGWGRAGCKYTFKIDGSIVDIVAKGKGSIKSNEELSKVISDDENREAFLADGTAPVFKNVYNYTCFYPVVQTNDGTQKPTWQVVSQQQYQSLFDQYIAKADLINALSAAGALSDKGKAKVKKDEEKKKKKSGVVLPDDKKKTTTNTSSSGAGWLALLGVAAAAYIYSQNK